MSSEGLWAASQAALGVYLSAPSQHKKGWPSSKGDSWLCIQKLSWRVAMSSPSHRHVANAGLGAHMLHTLTCLASQTSSSYTRTLRFRSSSMGPYSTWMYLQARQTPSQHMLTEQGNERMGRRILLAHHTYRTMLGALDSSLSRLVALLSDCSCNRQQAKALLLASCGRGWLVAHTCLLPGDTGPLGGPLRRGSLPAQPQSWASWGWSAAS